MTLKEKFEIATDGWIVADKCEDVADEFAIGFAEWLNEEYSYHHGDGEYYDHVENKWYKLKELLEMYKKEKENKTE